MLSKSLSDLEAAIGLAAGQNNCDIIETAVRGNTRLRQNLNQWLILQGIPSKNATAAFDKSAATAYAVPSYLFAWRKRINPRWEDAMKLLGEQTQEAQGEPKVEPPPPAAKSEPKLDPILTDIAEPKAPLDLSVLKSQINNLVAEAIASRNLTLSDNDKEAIKRLAAQSAADKIAELAPPRRIEVANKTTGQVTSIGLQHETFPTLLRAVEARDHRGFHLNIWLTGPTGSGKTTAAEAAAKALSLPFGSDGSLDADYKVLGFRDANGNIISTQFLDIYENGGIYVADEIDNWLPSALLSLNAALANGFCSSPKGLVQRHKDACVIACANTWGLGATGDYVGRTRLDAASLDRFQPKINWPYDERLELALAQAQGGTIGQNWCQTVQSVRQATLKQGLKVIISPRATFAGIALLAQGFRRAEVIEMTLTPGLSPEQRRTVLASCAEAQTRSVA